ncbi:helix-turn-helix domain-containing protein [Streptomyces sp. AP-93]|uniref:helix-turn-helix domain-containing protein n=1 Tax=Streptomyces sp. AP-93 TaxID=2929048 RepID=UPI001FB0328A|nr:helix-turn-helix domain-containing protein [Streptomyces sp. AP-93]MCJ0875267.1 helix-turn-helix domain-containing protein [Streptomyces sp. AP-93]
MSETRYGFEAPRFRAARTAAGTSVARIARTARVSERAVSLYLAGSRTPRPGVLVLLAEAVGVEPSDLCAVDRVTLAHLRVFTGRSRAAMARELDMAEETYRQLETTGNRGRLASSRYSYHEERWIAWMEWAPPKFGVTAARLAAAEQHTREDHQADLERRWQQLRQTDPAFAARVEELGRLGRALREQ